MEKLLIKNVSSKIYSIRGVNVMLDRDLSVFYGVAKCDTF